MSTTIDFSDALTALVARHGDEWVARQVRTVCPDATALDIQAALYEGAWDREHCRAVESLVIQIHEREFGPVLPPAPPTPKPITLRDYKRTGLTMGDAGVAPIEHDAVRMTLPVREALVAAGATVTPISSGPDQIAVYHVRLGDRIPAGIVATTTDVSEHGWIPTLRMTHEPDFSEFCRTADVHWTSVDWTPCPKCGAPLVWYEAGYAPGYRVCSRPPHHHMQA